MMDLGGNGQAQQVAAHDQAVRCVRMFQFQGNDMLATGSWDKTVKFWDLRQQQPAMSVNMQDRVYTMDVKNNSIMVVGCAERYINIFDLAGGNPSQFKTVQSPLKWQTRVVSCFSDATGFAVGSIEGRCAIQYANEKDSRYAQSIPLALSSEPKTNMTNSKNFSFKCHRQADASARDTTKVYAVNAISFHPQHGTFSTAGSDGTFHFWDKDAKHRLKGYPEVGGSISATGFNRNGNIFAYAVSYDWSKGYAHNTPGYPNKIMLHPIVGDECKPRAAGKR
jgi:mRNA export factor